MNFPLLIHCLSSDNHYSGAPRELAQLARALALGARGSGFESPVPDHWSKTDFESALDHIL
jgi:hypothetical protein